MSEYEPIQYGIGKNGDRYNVAVKNLTRGEVLELSVVLRRLDLYRVSMLDTDVVESAIQSMAKFEVSKL